MSLIEGFDNPFGDNLDFTGDGGVVNSEGPYTSAAPDASGGTGSFLTSLIPTLTNGLNATINAKLLSSLGQNSQLYTVDINGNLVPKSAAALTNAKAYQASGVMPSAFANPSVILAGVAVLGFFVWAITRK